MNRSFRRLACASALFLQTAGAAANDTEAPANAGSGDAGEGQQVTAARYEFRRGTELARAARWDEARAAFERSSTLHAHPVTTYNVAYCQRAMGHPAAALRGFERALLEHSAATGGLLPEHLLLQAERYRSEAERRVARLTLRVAPGASVAVDGEASPGNGVWLLDPGAHVIVVSKAGFATHVVNRVLATGQHLELLVTLEPRIIVQAAPARRDHAAWTGPDRRWAHAALGVSVATLVAAGISGALALRKESLLSDACGEGRKACPANREGDIAALRHYADTATAAGIIGGVGLSLSAMLWLVSAPAPDSANSSPTTSWRGVSLTGHFD